MKQILFLFLLIFVFILSIPAQRKPPTKSVKIQPQKVKEVTEQIGTTSDGKSVVLKSDGTWQFSQSKTSQQTKAKPCNLTLEDAPTIRGIRLGMTKELVEGIFSINRNVYKDPLRFAGSGISESPNGVTIYKFYNSDLIKLQTNSKQFTDVYLLELGFFKEELHSISIKYSLSGVYFTRQEFKLKINESFNLPLESWVSIPDTSIDSMFIAGAEVLKCSEFQIRIETGNEFTLTNLITSQMIEGTEEDKRKTFKP